MNQQTNNESETSSQQEQKRVATVHRGIVYWTGREQPDGTDLYITPPDIGETIRAISKASDAREAALENQINDQSKQIESLKLELEQYKFLANMVEDYRNAAGYRSTNLALQNMFDALDEIEVNHD